MSPGDLILASLQQSDGQIKKRPILILKETPPFNDLLVCGVSSQLKQEVKGLDQVVWDKDSDFSSSGLKVSSLIRLGMVATIPKKTALGRIGSISSGRLAELRRDLAKFIES